MTTQPEALRLARLLEQIDGQHWQVQDSAAAELRRLYDLADKYKWQVIDTCARAEKAEAQRDALLEALKQIEPILARMYGPQAAELPPMQIVRAAIAKTEGQA